MPDRPFVHDFFETPVWFPQRRLSNAYTTFATLLIILAIIVDFQNIVI